MARKTKSLREMVERKCPMCEMAGLRSSMLHDKPKLDHYYCTSCGYMEIDWSPICRRVENELLYEYFAAKAALAASPAAPIANYETPRVDGGNALSQQERFVTTNQHDRWVVMLVEQVMRCGLTKEEKDFVVARYFERWSYRAIAAGMHMAMSTVQERRESALRQFARAARWM